MKQTVIKARRVYAIRNIFYHTNSSTQAVKGLYFLRGVGIYNKNKQK